MVVMVLQAFAFERLMQRNEECTWLQQNPVEGDGEIPAPCPLPPAFAGAGMQGQACWNDDPKTTLHGRIATFPISELAHRFLNGYHY